MANFDSSSKPLVQASAKGTIKWFNATKGYGFVTLESGGDAFCHASALQPTGHAELPQGAGVVCDLANSDRGLQVVTVHSVDLSTAEAAPPRKPRRDFGDRGGYSDRGGFGGDRGGFGGGDRFGGDDRFSGHGYRDSGGSGAMAEGKVKFFNDQKGFGFVMPEGGGGDIYLHASALRRSGVQAVEADQRIRFSTRQGTKGVEVDRVEII